MFVDSFGRAITYLRISVTDRCNLRCVYCMPPDGVDWQPHPTIMRYEEIAEVVRVAAEHGVREVRLTGGEPLVRKDITELVRLIANTPGVEDVSLTTNALLLENLAEPLAQAGLKRVNVSLDTLDAQKFAHITRGGSFERSWRGILAAEAAGLRPVKINSVAMRGVNDDELAALAGLTLERDWHVRFIELMPVKNQALWGEGFPPPQAAYLSIQEMLKILEPLGLEAVEKTVGSGPAREFRLRGAKGRVGFISPVGEHFCQFCNRLRLTADGNLRPCLLSDVEIPLLDTLRAGGDILPLLQRAVGMKPESHELDQAHMPKRRTMMQIGG